MSLEYIRKTYNVPAQVGRYVKSKIDGRVGRIAGAKGAYVAMTPLRDSRKRQWIYHPRDLEYMGMELDLVQLMEALK